MTLLREVSGGLLTLSWSLEGIALLALGFALRERALRLSGLSLLLLCIGKVFFYDLRNLETIFRILSFIGLGVVLLLVSWIYTRFKDQMHKYLWTKRLLPSQRHPDRSRRVGGPVLNHNA